MGITINQALALKRNDSILVHLHDGTWREATFITIGIVSPINLKRKTMIVLAMYHSPLKEDYLKDVYFRNWFNLQDVRLNNKKHKGEK